MTFGQSRREKKKCPFIPWTCLPILALFDFQSPPIACFGFNLTAHQVTSSLNTIQFGDIDCAWQKTNVDCLCCVYILHSSRLRHSPANLQFRYLAPSPNPGFLPLAYRDCSRLPDRTRDKILKFVQQDLFGEQQPGTAFVVKNTGKNEKYKYVAFLSLVRVADVPHPVEFAYTALRGLLLSILEFNQKKEGPSIEVIAIPSFALNNSPEHKRYVSTILPIGESRSNFRLPTAK